MHLNKGVFDLSTTYYLTNVKKKESYDRFLEFWQTEIVEMIEEKIKAYCKKNTDNYVNSDFAEELIESTSISSLRWGPDICDRAEGERIGTSTAKAFYWDRLSIDCHCIYSYESLLRFLKSHPEYSITDEYNKTVCAEEFENICKK